MATVLITFFLITQLLYVCKMDADSRERRRNISERENRWSMNSQRVEEIVAELMRPISDVRRNFDRDFSALLEEYLTEAGLRALDAEEEEINTVIPNFTEVALLLQQSASIYSRKVDFLYQHVLNVCDSLNNSTMAGPSEAPSPPTPARARRKRKASTRDFVPLELEASAAARRVLPARPPPTLPRVYVDLEPRVLGPRDYLLLDYAGEPVGLLTDFHVTWRLHEGQLVEELEEGVGGGPSPRAPPPAELQAALAAAAPPSPPPRASTPLPALTDTAPTLPSTDTAPTLPSTDTGPTLPNTAPADLTSTELASTELAVQKKDKKRQSRLISTVDDISECVKHFHISEEARALLARQQEFGVPRRWRRRVLAARRAELRALRRRLRLRRPRADLRGFDLADARDIGGFVGWSRSEAAAPAAGAEVLAAALEAAAGVAGAGAAPAGEGAAAAGAGGEARRGDDSDDDGFFEQSSFGDSDTSRADDALAQLPGGAEEWAGWRARVLARAAAGEAAGGDVRGACGAVLRAAPPPAAARWPALLARADAGPSDVSKLFLATLFLANAGSVEIVPDAPLAPGAFSVRALPPAPAPHHPAPHHPAPHHAAHHNPAPHHPAPHHPAPQHPGHSSSPG